MWRVLALSEFMVHGSTTSTDFPPNY